jgi:hypothetical protein
LGNALRAKQCCKAFCVRDVNCFCRRAKAALLCRHIAAALGGSEAAGYVWHEATLPTLLLCDKSFDSLLTWAARRSKALQRLRLSLIEIGKVGQQLR